MSILWPSINGDNNADRWEICPKTADIFNVFEFFWTGGIERGGILRRGKPGRVPGGTMAGPGDMIYARVGPLVEMHLFKKIDIGICIIQIITTEERKLA